MSIPPNLQGLKGAPKKLYIKGEILPEDDLAVAIVGTRHPTQYGIQMARKFATELANEKICIISGLARGIDTVAHEAALKTGGRTIAVLGSGLDVIYPSENIKLANKIIKNGALVSEFPKGTKPLGRNFLARNRIVSGLSLAIIVVEGKEHSGTLSTAAHAANQGREVLAVPGQINCPQSFAPHYLIDNGARIARNVQDVIDAIR